MSVLVNFSARVEPHQSYAAPWALTRSRVIGLSNEQRGRCVWLAAKSCGRQPAVARFRRGEFAAFYVLVRAFDAIAGVASTQGQLSGARHESALRQTLRDRQMTGSGRLKTPGSARRDQLCESREAAGLGTAGLRRAMRPDASRAGASHTWRSRKPRHPR